MPETLHSLIKNRRSGRIIDPDKAVSRNTLRSLTEAARWAPSCGNHQSWRFVVSTGETLEPLKNTLTRGNSWARKAPVLIAAVTSAELGCQKPGRDYSALDLGLSLENMLLQGIHLGLVMHPMAGFDEDAARAVLGIPDPFRIFALIAAGYPGSPDQADARTLSKEAEPRERKPVSETVFQDRWPDR